MKPTREPTSDECTANTIYDFGGERWMAAWYPQMGGYTSFCWVNIRKPELRYLDGSKETMLPCFECLVWHDGEFPFEGGSGRGLHHCSAEQFISFGQKVKAAQEAAGRVTDG